MRTPLEKGAITMKATGIVRRIDDLGRVVVPKEIRRTLRIREGDPLEIFTDREGEIILKKYSPIGELSLFAKYGELTIYQSTSPREISEHLKDADVAILNKVKLGAEQLKNAASLKLICISATGFDNVDLDYCRAHGIAVSNVVGYSTQSVAQVTLAMVLSLMTHLPQYCEITRNGS